MTKIKIWLTENKSVTFENEKSFDDNVKDIFKGKVFILAKKDKLSLAVNTSEIILVEQGL